MDIGKIKEYRCNLEKSGKLLTGGKKISKEELKEEEVVNNIIEYIEKVKKFNGINIFWIISLIFLSSAFVCLLCNFAISRSFDWSLYPVGGLLLLWATTIPVFFMKKHKVLLSMATMFVLLIPYLVLIEYLCPVKGWAIPLALPIAGVALIAVLIVVTLFLYTKINRYYSVAMSCLLFGAIVNLIINRIVYNYVKEDGIDISAAITAISFTFVSLLIFIIGFIKKKGNLKGNQG